MQLLKSLQAPLLLPLTHASTPACSTPSSAAVTSHIATHIPQAHTRLQHAQQRAHATTPHQLAQVGRVLAAEGLHRPRAGMETQHWWEAGCAATVRITVQLRSSAVAHNRSSWMQGRLESTREELK